jgi:nickel-dependent lactate racemase
VRCSFGYGKGVLETDIPDANFLSELRANPLPALRDEAEEVLSALARPIASKRLKDIALPGEHVVIVTSDITRPMPSARVLPFVIGELKAAGLSEDDITVVLALGNHRRHTAQEKESLVGKGLTESGVRVLDSNVSLCVRLGFCSNGTPVDIFEPVAAADRVILLGNIEFHYFAGYSGGLKAVMPGVSSREAIQANHANMIHPNAKAGNLESNPVRQDIDEVGRFLKVDFILNVILDEHKRIVKAVAGDPFEAHREGCRFLDTLYKIRIARRADIVIVSPGGFPKDINLYQAQKALDNAKEAVRDGGIILLVASSPEGFGERVFEEWMRTKTPDEMIEEIRRNFVLGGHKAAAVALVLKRNRIFFISDLPESLVRSIGFEPFSGIEPAVAAALNALGPCSTIMTIPSGGSILPVCDE